MWVLGVEPGPLEEQTVLFSAEPSLNPLASCSIQSGSPEDKMPHLLLEIPFLFFCFFESRFLCVALAILEFTL